MWTDDATENTIGYVPVIYDPTISGVPNSYFQSGIGAQNDLLLKDVHSFPASGVATLLGNNVWTPEIEHGYYHDGSTEEYLFSDDSEVIYPTHSGVVPGVLYTGVTSTDSVVSGFNVISLKSLPKIGTPIVANQYTWDPTEERYEASTIWRKRVHFTGIEDSDGEESATYSDVVTNTIYFNNIDRSENEIIVSYSGVSNSSGLPNVVFNNQCSDEVGFTPSGVLFSGLEIVGISTGGPSQEFHTTYSPVDSGMQVGVFSFTTVPNGLLPSGVVASGILGNGLIGGGLLYSGLIEDGYMSTDVTDWVPRSTGTTFSGYQVNVDYDLGLLQFGDATQSGVDFTTPVQPAAGEYIGIAYYKTARVEYEPQDSTNYLLATEANLNPFLRHRGDGFVYLSTHEVDPASITLEAEHLPLLSLDTYGPLNIGSNYSSIAATVKDNTGAPLEGESVTIWISSSPEIGSFGSLTSATAVTDFNGKARAYYTTPLSVYDLGKEVIASGYSVDNAPSYAGLTQTTTLNLTNALIETNLDETYLYKNFVDDPLLGFLETSISQNDADAQLEEYYRTYLLEHGIYGPTGLDNSDQVQDYLINQSWEDAHRMLWDLSRPSLYSPNTGMGRKTIVAAPTYLALDPHTLEQNAWAPVRPYTIIDNGNSNYDFVYDTSMYTIPVPSGTQGPVTSGEHYSYFIVAPAYVDIQASVYNTVQQRTMYSNTIRVKLGIPDYMSGELALSELSSIEKEELNSLFTGVVESGQVLPLGFRIKSSSLTLAAALDGVTFLDINPEYNANIWDIDEIVPLQHEITISGIV